MRQTNICSKWVIVKKVDFNVCNKICYDQILTSLSEFGIMGGIGAGWSHNDVLVWTTTQQRRHGEIWLLGVCVALAVISAQVSSR